MQCIICESPINAELQRIDPPMPAVATGGVGISTHTVTYYCGHCDMVGEAVIVLDRSTGRMHCTSAQHYAQPAEMRKRLNKLPLKGAGIIYRGKKIGPHRIGSSGNRTRARAAS